MFSVRLQYDKQRKKLVTPLLTVHKQSLPFRQVTSVTTPSMSTSLILWMCRIKRAQSLVTHDTSKRSFQPHHQHKSCVQQCMLRQDTCTLTVLHGIKLGVCVVKSLNQSLWPYMLIIFVPFLCLHLVTSALNPSPVISVSLRNSCRRDPFIDIHYYSQCFFPFLME